MIVDKTDKWESRQVVNGPSRIFDAREARMRDDAARLKARPLYPLHAEPLLCATVNCNQVRTPGSRHCRRCDEELTALAEWRGRHSGPGYVAKMQLRGERLKGFALLLLFIGLMSAIGVSVWPYIFAMLKLWGNLLGGAQ
jgi:hypothetical protein